MKHAVGAIEMGRGVGDAVFCIDLTGSYFSSQLSITIDALQAFLAQTTIADAAVVTHSDYPGYVVDLTTSQNVQLGIYDSANPAESDYAFRVDLPFDYPPAVSAFLPSLLSRSYLFGGGFSEPYTRAIWEMEQIDTQDQMGGSTSALVMFLDSVPHGYDPTDDILDPGRIGDSAQNTLIPYTSPLDFDASVSALSAKLIVVNSGAFADSFWQARVGSQVDEYLYWSDDSVSTLVNFLNNAL